MGGVLCCLDEVVVIASEICDGSCRIYAECVPRESSQWSFVANELRLCVKTPYYRRSSSHTLGINVSLVPHESSLGTSACQKKSVFKIGSCQKRVIVKSRNNSQSMMRGEDAGSDTPKLTTYGGRIMRRLG
jgi:hypothetical protein